MITRFEIIDHREGAAEPGRKVIVSPFRSDHQGITKVTYQIQDDHQTLKVFLSDAKQPTASDHELQSVEDGGAKKLYPPEEYNHIKD